ncbi:hypothetical protein B0H19DRAFT_1149593 [Mycena capillaripes]|nr:hypothetical protein B0H19DRAFT_1149593 [Mycena capillaripes]
MRQTTALLKFYTPHQPPNSGHPGGESFDAFPARYQGAVDTGASVFSFRPGRLSSPALSGQTIGLLILILCAVPHG